MSDNPNVIPRNPDGSFLAVSLEATQMLVKDAVDDATAAITSIRDVDGIKKIVDPVTVGASALPAGAATEATLATRATEATLATRASEATLTTRASEATLAAVAASLTSLDADIDVALSTRATEATLALIRAKTDNIDVALSTRASEATLATRATEATLVTLGSFLAATLDVALSTMASQVTAAAIQAAIENIRDTAGIKKITDALPTGTNHLGAVLVDNAAGAAAVNVQDGGNSLTVDGPLTDAELRASPVPISAASLPLPTGAATAANQTTVGSQTTKINDGTNTAAVTAASALKIDGSAVTQPISAAALPLPAGAATEATLATRATEATLALIRAKTDNIDVALSTRASEATLATRATEATLATRLADATFTGRINTLGQKTMAASTPVVVASDQTVIPVSDNGGSLTVDTPQLPAALVGGRLDENIGAWLGSTAPTVGQKTMANAVPVVIASDQTPIRSSTGSHTDVASSATNVTILASNVNRLGATIFNDSTKTLYLKLGATASTTSYTLKLGPDGYFEVPFGYTGIIDGIWSAANGNARVTELT